MSTRDVPAVDEAGLNGAGVNGAGVSGAGLNWAGNVRFGAVRVHRPESVDELRRLVRDSDRIRALGSRHSFSPVADTTGDLIRLDGLPPRIEFDSAAGTVTLGAGMRYAEVVGALHDGGFALANLASLPHISVAGSCATGTHGSGDAQPSLAAAVVGLQLVGPDGETRELNRDEQTFAGAVVALGALGIVTRLTLRVEPAFEVAQRVRVGVPLDEVTGQAEEIFGAAYSVSVFTDWRDEARVWLKYRTDAGEPGWDGGRSAPGPEHPVPGMPPDACTLQGDVPGPWHERLPHFRADFVPSAGQELQSEFFLPRSAAAEAFTALRGIGDRIAEVLHVSEIRTVRGDDLWLSPAYRRDSVTLHFTWVDDLTAVLPVLAAVEQRLMPLGARPHWGKLTTVAPSVVVAGYERAGDFAQLARSFDPTGTFRNAFVDDLFPTA